MVAREVSSRTFSMGAFEGSMGFGGTRVGPGMMGEQLSVAVGNASTIT